MTVSDLLFFSLCVAHYIKNYNRVPNYLKDLVKNYKVLFHTI